MYVVFVIAVILSCAQRTTALSPSHAKKTESFSKNRRECLQAPFCASTALLFLGLGTPTQAALAFDNKISTQYDDRPKRRGPVPKDLGLADRTTREGEEYRGLKECGFQSNCFNSYLNVEDDPEHAIPAWVWPEKLTAAQAMEDLTQVLTNYEPGQNGVDGGGFRIMQNKPDYIYVQYEALNSGYLDDVEFALDGDKVQVRSSSRIGFLDLGVNAIRLNYIAAKLREKGWNAVGVDYKKHPTYVSENRLEV